MIENQFKQICRFNRLMILAVFLLGVFTVWDLRAGWNNLMIDALLAGLNFVLLMGNEFLMKLIKRVREAELETIAHLTILVPSVTAIYIGANYLLTGQAAVALFGIFCVFQAQFLGAPKLSKVLAGVYIGFFLASLVIGLPHRPYFTPVSGFMAIVGFGLCLFEFGMMVARMVRAQMSQVDRLQSMAATDGLTGLTNRRQFNNRLHQEISRARRHNAPLSLALFDLDNFKHLNDFYGHPVGDRILQEVGKIVRQNIRESDLPARYGGEEFALILPETREAEAYELLERLRLLIAQTVFCLPENPLTVTVSIGVSQLEPRQHSAFELVELADKALYEAKRQGKNCVVKASMLSPKVLLSKPQDIGLLKASRAD